MPRKYHKLTLLWKIQLLHLQTDIGKVLELVPYFEFIATAFGGDLVDLHLWHRWFTIIITCYIWVCLGVHNGNFLHEDSHETGHCWVFCSLFAFLEKGVSLGFSSWPLGDVRDITIRGNIIKRFQLNTITPNSTKLTASYLCLNIIDTSDFPSSGDIFPLVLLIISLMFLNIAN